MKQLTDSMIGEVIKNDPDNHFYLLAAFVLFGVAILLVIRIYCMGSSKYLQSAGLVAIVLLLFLGIEGVCRCVGINYIIKRSEWVVDTDVVEKVTAYTDDGERKYYMLLEKYGRIELDGYEYRSGDEVYVVLFPSCSLLTALSGEYITQGEVYSTDTYIYVGTHSLK